MLRHFIGSLARMFESGTAIGILSRSTAASFVSEIVASEQSTDGCNHPAPGNHAVHPEGMEWLRQVRLIEAHRTKVQRVLTREYPETARSSSEDDRAGYRLFGCVSEASLGSRA
jgi:hypothetical protein